MTFREFLAKYRDDTLDTDVTWRAYDITGAVRPLHVKGALKALNLAYAGELGVGEAMRRYGMPDREEAEAVLGAWHLWRSISAGGLHRQVQKRRRAEGLGWLG